MTDHIRDTTAEVTVSESAETLTEAEITALPLDERIYFALLDAGLDESDAQAAGAAVVPIVVEAMQARAEAGWDERQAAERAYKPMRVYVSALTGRAYATNDYTERGGGVIAHTKHDVTGDVVRDLMALAWARGWNECNDASEGDAPDNPYRAALTGEGGRTLPPKPVDGLMDPCPTPGYAGRHTAVGAGAASSPYRCHGCGTWFTLPEATSTGEGDR